MRLWPYQILNVLPTKQLVAQWRECLAISGIIYGDGTNISLENINHATINRMKQYPIEHFAAYCDLVREAFGERDFTIGANTLNKLDKEINYGNLSYKLYHDYCEDYAFVDVCKDGHSAPLFGDFHNRRYIKQCLYMFQEKFDCGMITEEEWNALNRGGLI